MADASANEVSFVYEPYVSSMNQKTCNSDGNQQNVEGTTVKEGCYSLSLMTETLKYLTFSKMKK